MRSLFSFVFFATAVLASSRYSNVDPDHISDVTLVEDGGDVTLAKTQEPQTSRLLLLNKKQVALAEAEASPMSISCPNVYYNYPTIWDKYRSANVKACDDLRFVKVPVSLKHRGDVCAVLGLVLDKTRCCPRHCDLHCAKKCGLKCRNIETCHRMKNSCCTKSEPCSKKRDVQWTHCGETVVACKLPKCYCCQSPRVFHFDEVPMRATWFPDFPEDRTTPFTWNYEGFTVYNMLIFRPDTDTYPNETNAVVSKNNTLANDWPDIPSYMCRHEPFGVISFFVTFVDESPCGVFRKKNLVVKGYLNDKLVEKATQTIEITSERPTLFTPKKGTLSKIDKLYFENLDDGWFEIDDMILCL